MMPGSGAARPGRVLRFLQRGLLDAFMGLAAVVIERRIRRALRRGARAGLAAGAGGGSGAAGASGGRDQTG